MKRLGLTVMQNLAKLKGGEVLSTKYTTVRKKLRFKCKEEHVWWAYPYTIRAGSWCPKCSNEKKSKQLRLSFKDIKAFAKKNEGKCLSIEPDYKNFFSKLKWQCVRGHSFRANYHNMKRRSNWCLKCTDY